MGLTVYKDYFFLVFLIVLVFIPFNLAESVPIFARKYHKSCSMCHIAIPKLNEFGEQFRNNGYQFPGTVEEIPIWQSQQLPLSGMPHLMYINREVGNEMGIDTPTGIPQFEDLHINSFRNMGIELFSGGILGKHLSYFSMFEVHDEAELDIETEGAEPEHQSAHSEQVGDHEDREDDAEEDQEGAEHIAAEEFKGGKFRTSTHSENTQAFFVLNNLLGKDGFWKLGSRRNLLNFRMGLFEMEIPFSQLRSLTSEMADYMIYSIQPFKDGFRLNAPQLGMSVRGELPLDFSYELAIVNGTNNQFDLNEDKDFYLRFVKRFVNPKIRLFKGLRLGALYYTGQQNLETNVRTENVDIFRWGLDFSWELPWHFNLFGKRFEGFHIFGQWMRGEDDDTDPGNPGDQKFTFEGGFVEADIQLIKSKLFFISRYDFVNIDEQWKLNPTVVKLSGDVDEMRRWTVGLRYYFQANMFLYLEYANQQNMIGYPSAANGAARVVDVDSDWFMVMLAYTF
jgi:hypothetical protein